MLQPKDKLRREVRDVLLPYLKDVEGLSMHEVDDLVDKVIRTTIRVIKEELT